MKTDKAASNSDTLQTYSEQTEANRETAEQNPMIGFFAIGLVINIVIIAAFFYWAYTQWGKSDNRKDPPE